MRHCKAEHFQISQRPICEPHAATVQPRHHTATTLSHNHVVTQPHCHITTLSHDQAFTGPHCHTTTLSHNHAVTQQPRFHMTTLSHNSTHIYFGALLALVAHLSFLTGSTQWGFSGLDGVMALAAHGKLYWVLHCFDWKLEKWTQTINNLAFLLLSYWGCGWGGRTFWSKI